MKKKIQSEVLEFVSEKIKGMQNNLSTDDKLLSSKLLDSLGIIELVGFIESKFNFKIDQSDLKVEYLDSVNAITDYVISKVQGGDIYRK